MRHAIDKIAFLVHEPALWTHYSSVWEKLGNERFDIVLTERFRRSTRRPSSHGVDKFIANVNAHGYRIVWAKDHLRSGEKYRYCVSNHPVGGSSLAPAPIFKRSMRVGISAVKRAVNTLASTSGAPSPFRMHGFAPSQYWPMQLAEKRIRFMYGADVGDGWSLASWNRLFDAFLCHGPNDEEQISRRFTGRTWQMGYPRYDGYFDPKLDISDELKEFEPDPARKTVLWMPTFGDGACSIPAFAHGLAPYNSRYNLIVRPHPLSFREKPEDIQLLRSLGYRLDDNSVRDMNKLYRLVDFVVCDYGGSAFGAVYLRKKMVLLDVPQSHAWYTVRNSSNLELTAHYPNLGPGQLDQLGALLDDENYWAIQSERTTALADRYFADYRGTSSQKAAEILLNLDSLLA